MRLHLRTSLVVIAVLLLGLPAAARASGADVIRDCADDGKLDKPYTAKELQDAERNLPSDIDEYTRTGGRDHHRIGRRRGLGAGRERAHRRPERQRQGQAPPDRDRGRPDHPR
jgi:hypothetical protein